MPKIIQRVSFCCLQPSLMDTGHNSEQKTLLTPEVPSVCVASPSDTANKETKQSLFKHACDLNLVTLPRY